MDALKNMFSFLTGNTNQIDKPIFTKPYIDKTHDMLELARRLDQAPEESKPLFRDAMESLASRVKSHQAVNDLLANSGLPILILYDLHILCSAGSASIDYVILSNRFLVTISCPSRQDLLTAEESRATAAPGEQRRFSASEHSAYILRELLKEEHMVNKKILQMIWPITVLTEVSGDSAFEEPLSSVPSAFSKLYPEIHRTLTVKPEDFIKQIKQLFQFDDSFSWLTNNEIFAISDLLIKYDKSSSCSADEQKG